MRVSPFRRSMAVCLLLHLQGKPRMWVLMAVCQERTANGFSLCPLWGFMSGPPYSVHQEMGENDMQGFIFSLITCFSTSQSWRFFCEMKFGEKTGCTAVLGWLSLQSSGGACGPVTPQKETELGSVSTAGSQEGAGPCSHISELQATFQLPSASQKDVHLSKEHQDRANNTQNSGWGI